MLVALGGIADVRARLDGQARASSSWDRRCSSHAEPAPWVPRIQIIEIRNNPVIAPVMRTVEPFYLEPHELPEHAKWLWGGPVHIFQTRVEELQADHLINWLSELVG